jgi:tRNA G18 (ribose-2'-O)-methylase SpoU
MPGAIKISDPADPRLAAYLSVRERDLASAHGARFIVEGKVALTALLTQSDFAIESLFLCETRLAPLADLVARVPPGVPIYLAPQGLMDTIVGFPIHRGVLACGLKRTAHTAQTLIDIARAKPRAIILILSDISNHDNVGALFRNAAAFGADAVLLDARCCDPLYRKAIRVSSGTTLSLPFVHTGDASDLIGSAQSAGFTLWALTPQMAAAPLASLPCPDHVALVLGAEGPGLPQPLIDACQPVRIPMQTGFDSINVATAAAIALAHVFSVHG